MPLSTVAYQLTAMRPFLSISSELLRASQWSFHVNSDLASLWRAYQVVHSVSLSPSPRVARKCILARVWHSDDAVANDGESASTPSIVIFAKLSLALTKGVGLQALVPSTDESATLAESARHERPRPRRLPDCLTTSSPPGSA